MLTKSKGVVRAMRIWMFGEPGSAGRDLDIVRNEPTSGLWIFAILTLLLVDLGTTLDPGRDQEACVRRVADLVRIKLDTSPLCGEVPTSLGSALLHIVVLAAGTWFFRECARWGYRCLGRRSWRQQLWRRGSRLVYLAAVVDLLVLLFSMVQHWFGLDVAARDLVGIRTLFFTPCVLVAVVVLFTGFRRFALPWTVPPSADATVDKPTVPPALAVRDPAEPNQAEPNPPGPQDAEPQNAKPGNPEPRPGPALPGQGEDGPDRGAPIWFVDPNNENYPSARYGIGLSGGGIRSAAFCSGVLQSLAGTPWSPSRADYLATVSGGGYVGVSTQIIRHAQCGLDPAERIDPYAADAPETPGFARRHRYLGDDALERAQVLLALLTGWTLNGLLTAGPLVLIGTGLAVLPKMSAGSLATIIVQVAAALALFVAVVLLLVSGAEGSFRFWIDTAKQRSTKEIVGKLAEPQELESVAKRCRRSAGLLVVAGSVAVAVSTAFSWSWFVSTSSFAIGGLILWSYATARADAVAQNFSRVLFVAAWASVGLIGIGFSASGRLGNPTSWAAATSGGYWPAAWVVAFAALLAAFLFLDQTSWSPHPFYKARIAATFAVRRISEGARQDYQTLPYDEYSYLDDWAVPVHDGPTLLVCATANAEDVTLPPRNTRAVPFVFSHDHVGSPELGWWTTADFRRCLGRQLAVDGTLQAATAISGAAIASGLGVQGRIPSVGTAFALLNARLGVWLPNPHQPGKKKFEWPDDEHRPARWSARFRSTWLRRRKPLWLWREVAGFLPSNKRFIYVSDGGHLDNLGLLELLRRRNRTILIVDASADKPLRTDVLDGVLALAADHFGIRYEREKSNPLTTGSTFSEDGSGGGVAGVSTDCVERVKITYPALPKDVPEEVGILVVAKARLARSLHQDDEAWKVVTAIRASNAPRWWPWSLRSLPTTLTANQSLTDKQFQSYVWLGNAVGRRALERLAEDGGPPPTGARPTVATPGTTPTGTPSMPVQPSTGRVPVIDEPDPPPGIDDELVSSAPTRAEPAQSR